MLAGFDAIGGFVIGGAAGGSFWLEISDTEIFKTGGTSSGPKTLTTAPVTVTPHGGAGSPSYSWVRTSGSAAITATSSAMAETAFTATLNPDEQFDAVFTCTVTDVSGAVQTITVSVTISLVSYA